MDQPSCRSPIMNWITNCPFGVPSTTVCLKNTTVSAPPTTTNWSLKHKSWALNRRAKTPTCCLQGRVGKKTVEHQLLEPTFVIDYPASLCPLTKTKADDPTIAERFELYIAGMEIANAYTELNDPDVQEANFKKQIAGLDDEEATFRTMDQDFIDALRVGMPPAGGLGVGIDRVVMLLTNKP